MELTESDFSESDWQQVAEPVHGLFFEMHALVFHEMADGVWVTPDQLEPRTVPSLIAEVRAVLERLDVHLEEARAAIAAAERAARLRAINRARRAGRR